MRKSSNSSRLQLDADHYERGTYTSVQFKGFAGRFLASICSSKAFLYGGLHLIHYTEQLLSATTEAEAEREILDQILPSLLHLSSNISEPPSEYVISLPLSPEDKSRLAEFHLRGHLNHMGEDSLNLLNKTARDYKFLMEFGVTNPSVLLAGIYRVQAKTIHQRLYLARSQGLISSFGRGRTQSQERS